MSGIGKGSRTDAYDEMLKDTPKKSLLDIVNVMNDYIKLMIPLSAQQLLPPILLY